MEDPSNWHDCLVCGEKTRFFHLNSQICRSCSGFLRRIVSENLVYRCKRDGNCDISASRTSCRGCRYQRALKAGVCLDALKNTSEPGVKSKGKTKILDNLVKGYDTLIQAQRAIHLELSPELGLDNKTLILAQKKQIVKVEQRTLPLIIAFFNENFGPFKEFPQDIKLKVISDTLSDFGIIYRAYLTTIYFPAVDDTRVCFTNAYYMTLDPSLIEWFFEGYISMDKVNDHLQIIGSLHNKYQKSVAKFKKLGPRKIDTVALTALSFFKRLELADTLNTELIEFKDNLMTEWAKDLRKTYGAANGNLKLTKFMQFFVEIDDLSNDVRQIVTLLNLNSLTIGKDQLCEVIEHLKTLDL